MASPQTENGYVRIANELIEAMVAFNLNGREFRLLLLIIRETYGYNKKEAFVTLATMQKKTKIDKTNCSKIINSLQKKNIIRVVKNDNAEGKKYLLNKDYQQWQGVVKNDNGGLLNSTTGGTKNTEKRDITKGCEVFGVVENDNKWLSKMTIGSIFKERQLKTKDKDSAIASKISISIPYQEIIQYLNEKSGCSYRPNTQKNKDLINARWNEGFRFDDFKKVIDNKTTTWLHDPKMNKFIRPETLFGNKFEGYLNERIGLADRGVVSSRTEKNMSTIANWMTKNKEGVKIA